MEEKAYSKKKIDKPIWDVDETSNAASAPAKLGALFIGLTHEPSSRF